MAPEGYPPCPDLLDAESLRHIVRGSVIEPAAPEYPADAQDRALDYAESHHAPVEVLGARGAVDAVPAQEGGDEFLISFHR